MTEPNPVIDPTPGWLNVLLAKIVLVCGIVTTAGGPLVAYLTTLSGTYPALAMTTALVGAIVTLAGAVWHSLNAHSTQVVRAAMIARGLKVLLFCGCLLSLLGCQTPQQVYTGDRALFLAGTVAANVGGFSANVAPQASVCSADLATFSDWLTANPTLAATPGFVPAMQSQTTADVLVFDVQVALNAAAKAKAAEKAATQPAPPAALKGK